MIAHTESATQPALPGAIQIAQALESLDWSDVPLGHKAILKAAVATLQGEQPSSQKKETIARHTKFLTELVDDEQFRTELFAHYPELESRLKAWFTQSSAGERIAQQKDHAVTFVHELAMGVYRSEEIEARSKAIAKMAPLTSTLVASSTPQPSQEPRKMTMSPADITMHDLIANQLEAFGWTKSDGAAIATKRYDTAAGQREAQLYFSVHGGESDCYLLQGQYWSEGRNALSTCMLNLPKGVDLAQVPERISVYAQEVENTVHQTYAARLYRSRSEPIAGGAEQSILRDILLEAAAIIAAIPKEHEPDNMRAPIADELEGFAGMLSDGVQPSDMQDILAEAASIIASIPQGYEPQNMRFPIVDELEGFAASFAPSVSSSPKP